MAQEATGSRLDLPPRDDTVIIREASRRARSEAMANSRAVIGQPCDPPSTRSRTSEVASGAATGCSSGDVLTVVDAVWNHEWTVWAASGLLSTSTSTSTPTSRRRVPTPGYARARPTGVDAARCGSWTSTAEVTCSVRLPISRRRCSACGMTGRRNRSQRRVQICERRRRPLHAAP